MPLYVLFSSHYWQTLYRRYVPAPNADNPQARNECSTRIAFYSECLRCHSLCAHSSPRRQIVISSCSNFGTENNQTIPKRTFHTPIKLPGKAYSKGASRGIPDVVADAAQPGKSVFETPQSIQPFWSGNPRWSLYSDRASTPV